MNMVFIFKFHFSYSFLNLEKTLLIYAAINLDELLVALLLEYNADANYQDKESKNALYYALDQEEENLIIINSLKNFTNLNQEGINSNSYSLLSLAILRGHINSLIVLLDVKGMIVDHQNINTGFTSKLNFLIWK